MVWIQHSELKDYYEDLLCSTPPSARQPELQSKVYETKQSLKTASNESPETKRIRNGYRQLRSASNLNQQSLKRTAPDTSTAKKLLKRVSTLGRGSSKNILCEFSSIKLLSTAEKQKLCHADIVLFSMVKDDVNFPALTDESKASSIKALRRLRKQWPIANVENVHPILFRKLYRINQNYLDNLSFGKTKKSGLKRKLRKSKEKDYTKIFVQTDAGARMSRALPCVAHSDQLWYIADGFVTEQFFTVEKTAEAENFEVTGVLEPVPTVDATITNQEELESSFRASHTWVASTQQRVNLCLLDAFHKFALCSVVYAALQQQGRTPERKWHLMKHSGASACMEDVILTTDIDGSVVLPIVDIPANLVPCAIDDDKPAFYVTTVQGSTEVAYVVKPRDIVKSRGIQDFVLSARITNILVLNDVNFDDLLITHAKGKYRLPEGRRFRSVTNSSLQFVPQYTDEGKNIIP